jgi:hypothetical protein
MRFCLCNIREMNATALISPLPDASRIVSRDAVVHSGVPPSQPLRGERVFSEGIRPVAINVSFIATATMRRV